MKVELRTVGMADDEAPMLLTGSLPYVNLPPGVQVTRITVPGYKGGDICITFTDQRSLNIAIRHFEGA